jgi:hypothetical protein
MTLFMYIGQAPQEINNETAPVKKKNKASFVVFFINLFLMVIALFMIKNQDKGRIEKQKETDANIDALPVEIIPTTETPAELNTTEAQNPISSEISNNAVSKNIVSSTAPANVGTAKTVPQAKKSTKTKTS